MSALGDRGITLEGLAAAVDALRQELATWKALARKQDALTADQITATQSGATAAKISQIAVNTAAIQSLAAQVAGQISLAYVTTLPATGEPLTLYLVPQGDGTAPNFCNEYLWINDAWELIGTTGAMANNGELAIQVNGVTVGTFTANQAANAAVNIAVPTNTNQLVNGAGYVDTAALQAALALKQNSLNATQLEAVNSGITAALVTQIGSNATAIAGKQDKLSAAQQAAVDSGATAAKIDQIAANASAIVSLTSSKQDQLSTTQLAAVNSGVTAAAVQQIGTNADNISGLQTAVATKAADSEVVHLAGAETITGDKTFTGATATHNITPETNGTYSLGSSSYQWSSVYAQTYYYGTTSFTDKFVTVDTEQSISKVKEFTQSNSDTLRLKNGRVAIGETISSDVFTQFSFRDKNTDNLAYIRDTYFTDGSTTLSFYVRNKYANGAPSTTGLVFYAYWGIGVDATGKPFASVRGDFAPYSNATYNLGTSTNKWKTLNGIDPGVLSFPTDSYINLDTTSWDLTGVTFTYTPSSDGWLMINVRPSNNFSRVAVEYATMRIASESSSGKNAMVTCPVRANKQYSVAINAASIAQARLISCLGNV